MAKAPKVFTIPKTKRLLTEQVKRRKQNQGAYARQKRRKYPTNSNRWLKIREAFKLHSIEQGTYHCVECLKQDGVYNIKSLHLDHINEDTYNNAFNNLQWLCHRHHSIKTNRVKK